MQVFQAKAFAKLNLALWLRGRREDGYHLLEMLNCRISLADTLTFESLPESSGVSLALGTGSALEDLPSERNLCVVAAQAFAREFDSKFGLRMVLEKVIPNGAGLGGGSSDAAEVLKYLFSQLPAEAQGSEANQARLRSVALSIGADVPYFLQGSAAVVRGIGECVEPIELRHLATLSCLLICPELHVSTPEVYRAAKESVQEFEARDVFSEEVFDELNEQPDKESFRRLLEQKMGNDLFAPAALVVPQLKSFREELRETFGREVFFSGSGSTFFILFDELSEAESASRQLHASADRQQFTSHICSFLA